MLALAVPWLVGCQNFFVSLIAFPPNRGVSIESSAARNDHCRRAMGADHFLRVLVGPPEASIGVWVIDPIDPSLDDDGWPHARRNVIEPRGTIFVLHGITDGPAFVRDKARAFARAGYRAVLIGLRGYAESTGEWRGYGVFERHDLVCVADALEEQGLLARPLAVWGVSYGGATAIQFAAVDPRVCAVVTVGAFADLLAATPSALRAVVPIAPWFYSDAQLRGFALTAAKSSGFHVEQASAIHNIGRIRAPILLIHGEWDLIVPFDHAERLHAAAPEHSHLLMIPATGHFGTFLDFGQRVERASLRWFDAALDPSRLAADPTGAPSEQAAPSQDERPECAP